MLNLFLPQLQNGERYVMSIRRLYYTLTLEKYEDLIQLINKKLDNNMVEEYSGDSRGLFLEQVQAEDLSILTISKPKDRVAERSFTRNSGEFFPYTHDFDDKELCEDLKKLGCWLEVDPNNYGNNCLLLAFEAAGVAKPAINAMRVQFLRCKISRHKLSQIVDAHKLYVIVRTDGSRTRGSERSCSQSKRSKEPFGSRNTDPSC